MNNDKEFAPKRLVFRKPKSSGYPQMRNIFAVPCVALTTLILAFATYFGFFPILILYAIWLTHILYGGRFIMRPTSEIRAPLALAILGIISIAWSSYPGLTAKPTLEGATMTVCSIIAARIVSLEAFIKGTIMGCLIVLIITLIDGKYGMDYMSGTYSLIGLFGSKNEVGLYAQLGFFMSLLHVFSKNKWREKIFLSVPSMILSLICLFLSRSATAVVSLAAVLAVCYMAYLITRLPRKNRIIAFWILGTLAGVAMFVALYLGQQAALLHALGKDTTLTGRTYLWSEGLKFGIKNPFLGTGYAGFWVVGQPVAEKLWYKFEIYGRSGFHFHNLFIQSFVDLGLVGLSLVVFMIIANCVSSFRDIIKNGTNLLGFYALGFSFMFLIRAYAEVDLLGTFGIGQFIFYSIAPRLAARSESVGVTAGGNTSRGKNVYRLHQLLKS